MKKLYILVLLFFSLTSCEKWLDVDPRSVVKEEEMFSDVKGFRSALLGVYTKMSGTKLYGANLTIGFVDVLAQYYNVESGQHSFYATANYRYEEAVTNINGIWGESYNAIANVNNILSWLQEKKDLFSPVEFDLIKAEAMAIRAFLHFDLLRLYAPSYTVNPNAKAIPYVNQVTNKPFPQLTVSQVIDAITADLVVAENLLRTIDPISPEYSGAAGTTADNTPEFFTFRYERMNYFAVAGTLARVYMWKGDKENAAIYATIAKRNASGGIIFNLFSEKTWDNSDLYFNSEGSANSKLILSEERKQLIYETDTYGSLDTRFKDWFKYYPGSNEEFLAKYMRPIPRTGNPPNLMLMRIEEMAYILSECATDDSTAFAQLNSARSRYGLKGANALVPGNCVLEEELFKEYRKTFIGEGQLFYYMKRKNYSEIPFSVVEDVQKAYVLPVPDLEIEFGLIN